MRKLTSLLALGLVLAVAAPAAAEPMTDEATLDEVVEYLDGQRRMLGIPGMAVAIVEGGDVILLETMGEASPGDPVDTDTLFLINSISKSIAAVSIVQLAEAGQVDLDASIATYLPETAPGGDEVTVADLLHHRSGITPEENSIPEDDQTTLEATVLRVADSFGPPGEFFYTNVNYDAVALIVERVSGLPYEDYVSEFVFASAGMADAVVGWTGADLPDAAKGHYPWVALGYRPHDEYRPGTELGGAITYATIEDMAAYALAHLDGSLVSVDGEEILRRGPVIDEDFGVEYAGGLFHEPAGIEGAAEAFVEHATQWHDGASMTWRSDLWFVPGLDLGMVILANGNDNIDPAWIGQLSYNTKLIMSGQEPSDVVPTASPLERASKWLALGLVLLQAVMAIAWFATGGRRLVGWMALVIDVVVLAYLTLGPTLVGGGVPLSVLMWNPDFEVIIWSAIVLLVWGAVRTVLMVRRSQSRNDLVTADA